MFNVLKYLDEALDTVTGRFDDEDEDDEEDDTGGVANDALGGVPEVENHNEGAAALNPRITTAAAESLRTKSEAFSHSCGVEGEEGQSNHQVTRAQAHSVSARGETQDPPNDNDPVDQNSSATRRANSANVKQQSTTAIISGGSETRSRRPNETGGLLQGTPPAGTGGNRGSLLFRNGSMETLVKQVLDQNVQHQQQQQLTVDQLEQEKERHEERGGLRKRAEDDDEDEKERRRVQALQAAIAMAEREEAVKREQEQHLRELQIEREKRQQLLAQEAIEKEWQQQRQKIKQEEEQMERKRVLRLRVEEEEREQLRLEAATKKREREQKEEEYNRLAAAIAADEAAAARKRVESEDSSREQQKRLREDEEDEKKCRRALSFAQEVQQHEQDLSATRNRDRESTRGRLVAMIADNKTAALATATATSTVETTEAGEHENDELKEQEQQSLREQKEEAERVERRRTALERDRRNEKRELAREAAADEAVAAEGKNKVDAPVATDIIANVQSAPSHRALGLSTVSPSLSPASSQRPNTPAHRAATSQGYRPPEFLSLGGATAVGVGSSNVDENRTKTGAPTGQGGIDEATTSRRRRRRQESVMQLGEGVDTSADRDRAREEAWAQARLIAEGNAKAEAIQAASARRHDLTESSGLFPRTVVVKADENFTNSINDRSGWEEEVTYLSAGHGVDGVNAARAPMPSPSVAGAGEEPVAGGTDGSSRYRAAQRITGQVENSAEEASQVWAGKGFLGSLMGGTKGQRAAGVPSESSVTSSQVSRHFFLLTFGPFYNRYVRPQMKG